MDSWSLPSLLLALPYLIPTFLAQHHGLHGLGVNCHDALLSARLIIHLLHLLKAGEEFSMTTKGIIG